jgi:glycosyltransferase involved in cell wall biosynthesis
MKIVTIAEDPEIAGGIPRYALPLSTELARRGAVVDYIYSGGYTGAYDWRLRKRWGAQVRDGVRIHGLVNATSIGMHGGHPELDVWNDDVPHFSSLIRRLQPDIIHLHSFLGIPVSAIEQFAQIAPVVLSVHDYALLCQRRVLVQRDESLCTTYPDQTDCARCVDIVDPRLYRLRARLNHTPHRAGMRLTHAAERLVKREIEVHSNGGSGQGADAARATRAFRARLADNVGIVNQHSAVVIAVSHGVREILVDAGINQGLVRMMHIGSSSAERLHRMPLPCESTGEVTFMFLGGIIPFKGPHVFVEALSRLAVPPRAIIAGRGYSGYLAKLREQAPSTVTFLPPFGSSEQPGILARADVVVAPAVGPDPGPQIVLEALAAGRPVIGSRIGGIPDFVTDGFNGRLVPSGDPEALARAIIDLNDPSRVRELAGNAKLQSGVKDHVDELERLYTEVLISSTQRPRVGS